MPNPLYNKQVAMPKGPGASKRPSPSFPGGSTPKGKNKSSGYPKNGSRELKSSGGHIGRFHL